MFSDTSDCSGLKKGKDEHESSKSARKVPNGMKISNVTVEGNTKHLQQTFIVIIKKAQMMLLDIPIETLQSK